MIMEHEKHFRKSMGTENVGPLLRTLVQMIRPQRILEVGAGYTTPFLLDGLKANEEIFDEGNLDPSYKKWHESNNDPRLVVIDTDPLPQLDSKYVEHIQGKFQGRSQELFDKYGEFDMVWFDCGSLDTFQHFQQAFWPLVNSNGGLILIHSLATNFHGQMFLAELKLAQATNAFNDFEIMTLIEPHKLWQNSITCIRLIGGLQTRINSLMP